MIFDYFYNKSTVFLFGFLVFIPHPNFNFEKYGRMLAGINKRSNGDDEDDQGAGCRDNFGQMGGGRFVC